MTSSGMCSVRFSVPSCFERIDTCLLLPLHFLLSKGNQCESPDSSSSWYFCRTNEPQPFVSNMLFEMAMENI